MCRWKQTFFVCPRMSGIYSPSVRRCLGHRVGLIKRDEDFIARHYIPVTLGETDYRCTYVTVTPFLAPESWLFFLVENSKLETRALLTSTSVLPWVYGEFCEYKLWLRQMIIHCWWAGSSTVLLHQWQCQSLQHKCSPNATQDATETPSRFISHAGKPVLSWCYCVLSPLYCQHRRWLWTSVTACFCTGQGMLKLNLGMFIFTVYSLFCAPVLTQLLCFVLHSGCNTYETASIIEVPALCLLELRAETESCDCRYADSHSSCGKSTVSLVIKELHSCILHVLWQITEKYLLSCWFLKHRVKDVRQDVTGQKKSSSFSAPDASTHRGTICLVCNHRSLFSLFHEFKEVINIPFRYWWEVFVLLRLNNTIAL